MGELPRDTFLLLSSQDRKLIDYLGLVPRAADEREEAVGSAGTGSGAAAVLVDPDPGAGADGDVVISASEGEEPEDPGRPRWPGLVPRAPGRTAPAAATAPSASAAEEEEVLPGPEECQGGLVPGRVLHFDPEDRVVPASVVTPDMLPTLTRIQLLGGRPQHPQSTCPWGRAEPEPEPAPGSPLQCVPRGPGASPDPDSQRPRPQSPRSLPTSPPFVFTHHERPPSPSTPRSRRRPHSQRSSSGSSRPSQRFSLKRCSPYSPYSPRSPESGPDQSPARASRRSSAGSSSQRSFQERPFRQRPPLRSPPPARTRSPGNLRGSSTTPPTSPGRDCDWSSLTSHSHAESAENLILSDASTDAPSPAGWGLSVCRAARSVFVDHDYLMMAVTDIVEVEASPGLSDADDDTMTPDSLEMGKAGAAPGYLGLDLDEDGAAGGTDACPGIDSVAVAQTEQQQHLQRGSGDDEQHDEDVPVQMGSGDDEQHDEDVPVQMGSGDDEQHDEDVPVQMGSGDDEQHDEDVPVQMGSGDDEQHDEDVRVQMGSDGVGGFGMGHHLDADEVLTQGTQGLDHPTHLIHAMKSLSFEDPLPTSSGGDGQELLGCEEPICVADDLEDLSDGILRGASEPPSPSPSPAKTQMWGAGVADLSPASNPSFLEHHDGECVDDCYKDDGNKEKEVSRVVTPSKMVPNVLSCVVPIGGLSGDIRKETSEENPEDRLALSQETTMNDWIVDIEADTLGRFTYYNENTEGELPDIFLQDDELHEPLKPSPGEDAEELQRQTSDISTSSSSPNRDLDALYLTQCAPLKRKATFKKQKQLPIKKTRRSWEQWYDQFKSVVTTGKQKFLSRSTLMSSDNKENLVPLRCDSQSPKLPCSQQELLILGSRNKQTTGHVPENIGCVKQSECKFPLEVFGTSWEHDESYTGKPDEQKDPEKVKPQQSGCSFNKSACRQLFKWSAVEPSLKGNKENAAAVTDEPECDNVPGNISSASRARSVVRVGLSKRARPRPLHQRKWWVIGILKTCVLQ